MMLPNHFLYAGVTFERCEVDYIAPGDKVLTFSDVINHLRGRHYARPPATVKSVTSMRDDQGGLWDVVVTDTRVIRVKGFQTMFKAS